MERSTNNSVACILPGTRTSGNVAALHVPALLLAPFLHRPTHMLFLFSTSSPRSTALLRMSWNPSGSTAATSCSPCCQTGSPAGCSPWCGFPPLQFFAFGLPTLAPSGYRQIAISVCSLGLLISWTMLLTSEYLAACLAVPLTSFAWTICRSARLGRATSL